MTFSLSIAHCPWIDVRAANLETMKLALASPPEGTAMWIHDRDFRGRPWIDVKHEWALDCWRWHLRAGKDHCIMMSDDLAIMPHFWDAVTQMVEARPEVPMGLMSNHPKAYPLLQAGLHWYRTRAWVVGPCILMPRPILEAFVTWYEKWYWELPTGKDEHGYREAAHDDSSINEFIFRAQGFAYHPIPAPIEHRLELGRSHDDKDFPEEAGESVSWQRRWITTNGLRTAYEMLPKQMVDWMCEREYWRTDAPFLNCTSEERRLGL